MEINDNLPTSYLKRLKRFVLINHHVKKSLSDTEFAS